jgi:RHS repeat-associated protein
LEGNRVAQYAYDQLQMSQAPRPRLAQQGPKPYLEISALTHEAPVKKQEIKLATIGALAGLLVQANAGDMYDQVLYYYVNDHLATPQLMVDNQGQVVWRADYDPFGAASVDAGSTATNQHRFSGQYYDEETQLHYNYHRYYEPRSGRYITPDPIGLEGGNNLFAYVGNNPINYDDSVGLYVEVGIRPFYPHPMPYMRHCFVRFNGNNNDTLSFDRQGVHKDPNPGGAGYSKTTGDKGGDRRCGSNNTDDCVRNEMKKCQGSDFSTLSFNCCRCVSNALYACGLKIEGPWPNSPSSTDNPPYYPPEKNPPEPIMGP